MRATLPIWQDVPYLPRRPLGEEIACDAVVVGGGIAGVSSAWQLAERGLDVVLLEAAAVASGATGRSGGFLMAGAAPHYPETVRRWGRERAARVHQATLDGRAALVDAARAAGVADAFRPTGLLRVAHDDEEREELLEHAAALARDGFAAELLEEGFRGRPALLTRADGAADPVALVRGLAAALERRGVRIFEGTPATLGPPGEVRTAQGGVRARHVVVALDGALAALVPAASAVRPRRLNACATAPAAPGLLPRPVYERHGLEYAQQRRDCRVVVGGFSDLDGDASWTAQPDISEPVQRRLEAYLSEELGVEAPVTHRWAGVVGYAADPLPRCGHVPGTDGRVLALGGYNGTGNVQAFTAARIVAELAVDGRSADDGLYAPIGA